MSKVTIDKAEGESASSILREEANTLADQIRQRAFELFVERGEADGFALDHWFRAERDLLQVPEAHMIEKDKSFHLHVAVPGLDEKDLKITALPNALIISAASKHKHSGINGDLHLCAFGDKRLFRRFDLSAPINTHKVHATVDNGLLKVTAFKQKKPVSELACVSGEAPPFFEDV